MGWVMMSERELNRIEVFMSAIACAASVLFWV